jgi:hypothetical protein
MWFSNWITNALLKNLRLTASTSALALRSNSASRHSSRILWGCFGLLLLANLARADTTYQLPDDFVHEAIPQDAAHPLKPSVLWLDKAIQDDISKILGHSYPQARLRYWRKDNASVWILEEIGKEYPITAGFIISDNQITRAQVLIYRETRGMEIHLTSFLAQFKGSQLDGDKLSHKVDGIAGATMSVNAMVKMAQVALLLNRKAQ